MAGSCGVFPFSREHRTAILKQSKFVLGKAAGVCVDVKIKVIQFVREFFTQKYSHSDVGGINPKKLERIAWHIIPRENALYVKFTFVSTIVERLLLSTGVLPKSVVVQVCSSRSGLVVRGCGRVCRHGGACRPDWCYCYSYGSVHLLHRNLYEITGIISRSEGKPVKANVIRSSAVIYRSIDFWETAKKTQPLLSRSQRVDLRMAFQCTRLSKWLSRIPVCDASGI